MSLSRYITRLALKAYDRPGRALLLWLMMLLVASLQLPNVSIDTSIEGLLGRDSPTSMDYWNFTRLFGSDRSIVITVAADDVLAEETLRRIQHLQDELEATLPYVSRIVSLVNAPQIALEQGDVYMGRALQDWPADADAWARRRSSILAYGPYQEVLVDQARKLTVLKVETLSQRPLEDGQMVSVGTHEYRQIMSVLKPVLLRHHAPGFELEVTGHAAVDAVIQGAFIQDLFVLGTAAFVLGMLLLLMLFRGVSSAILPMLVISSTVVVTIGSMALTGQKLQVPTTVLPPLIVIFGTADAVHFISAFYRRFHILQDKRQAFSDALDMTISPMILTTLTTAAGLLAFAFVDVRAQANLGIFGGVAALMALLFTLLCGAFVLRWMPEKDMVSAGYSGDFMAGFAAKMANTCVRIAAAAPRTIVMISVLTMLSGGVVVSQFRFSHDLVAWLPDEWSEVKALNLLGHHFGSGNSAELVIDSGASNGVYDPDFIHDLTVLQQAINQLVETVEIGRAISVIDMTSEVSLAMDGRVVDYAEEVNGERLLWRDLRFLQLGVKEDFYSYVSSDHRFARISISAPRSIEGDFAPYIHQVEQVIREHARQNNVLLTGLPVVVGETLEGISRGAAQSYVLATLAIALMMMIFLRCLSEGMITMIPNLLPVIVVMSGMYLAGTRLDVFTAMIASITIGIVVDDTIHFMSHFRRHLQSGVDVAVACRAALHQGGGAMLVTTLVLAMCFSVMHLSPLHNLNVFAFYSTGIVLVGLVADFLVLPALMILMHRK